MSKKEELKARLEKQTSSRESKVVVKKKKQEKTPKKRKQEFVPVKKVPEIITTKTLEKRSEDDEEFRKHVSDILDEKFLDDEKNTEKVYKLFKKSYEQIKKGEIVDQKLDTGFEFLDSDVRNAWESLDDKYKLEYILQSLTIDAPWPRKNLLNNLLKLTYELQEDYMKSYIRQDKLAYDSFYESWSIRPHISKQIQEIFSSKIEGSQNREEKIKNDILNNAKKYAEKNGIDISKQLQTKTVSGREIQPSYYSVIKKISKKTDKDLETLYKKFAKEWLIRAEILGIKNPEKLWLSDLASKIKREEDNIFKNPQYVELKGKSSSELREIDNSDYSDDLLIIKIIKEGKIKPKKSEIKTIMRGKVISEVSEKEVKKLVAKLAKITGKSEEFYKHWDMESLRDRYKAIEEGEEFWEEYNKENLIESLAETTGKDRSEYEKMEMEELLALVQNNQEKKKRKVEDAIYSKKCIDMFKTYKWIKGKVSGIWISGGGSKYHSEDSYISIASIGKFYIPNDKFFQLLSNRYKNLKYQKGYILHLFDNNKNKLEFKVAYTLSNYQAEYKGKLFPILSSSGKGDKFKKEKVLIQDEKIFEDEKVFLQNEQNATKSKIESILQNKLDKEAIGVGKRYLSQVLVKIAPENKDYNIDSNYLELCLASIEDSRNIGEFFEKIARFICILGMEASKTLKIRVKEQYYLPSGLLKLSDADMLPEIYEDPGIKESLKNNITSYIEHSVHTIVKNMGEGLYRIYDPTVRKEMRALQDGWTVLMHNQIIFSEPEIKYDENMCENDAETIPDERKIYYKDPETDKLYCLDFNIINSKFATGDFINPFTERQFSGDFINRYIVKYYDVENGETYTFIFIDLYNKFKTGDFINESTGRAFSKRFISLILKGNTFESSLDNRIRHFKRVHRRMLDCENPENIFDTPPEMVVYYKDPETGLKYCFQIDKLIESLKRNKINPATGKAFSEKFLNEFNMRYLAPKKSTDAEFKVIETSISTEKKSPIPDIWDILKQSVESKTPYSILGVKEGESQEEIKKIYKKLKQEGKDTEQIKKAYRELKAKFGFSKDETDKESVEEGDTEPYTETETEEDSNTDTESTLGESSGEIESEDKVNGDKVNGDKVKNTDYGTCSQCNAKLDDSFLKSIDWKDNTPKEVRFCCSGCFEKYKFSSIKKKKN